jgi:hypothetical protein
MTTQTNLTVAQGLALSASDRCRALRSTGETATMLRARADRRRSDAAWLSRSCLVQVTDILGGGR